MDGKSSYAKNYILVLAAGSLWGFIGFFVKRLSLAGSSPSYTTFLRLAFGFVILLAVSLAKAGPRAFLVGRKTLLSCFLLGVFSMALNNLCYSNAVDMVGMSMGVALLYSAPVFTCIESRLLFKEHIGKRKVAALILNIAGCVLAVTGGNFSEISFSVIGILFGIGAAVTYSTQGIFGSLATEGGDPFAVATYNFFFAVLFTAAVTRPWRGVADPLKPEILLNGFLFGLIPTAAAYILYFHGIKGIREVSRIPVLCSMEVVVATVLGICIFGERIAAAGILGLAAILVSVVIMSR